MDFVSNHSELQGVLPLHDFITQAIAVARRLLEETTSDLDDRLATVYSETAAPIGTTPCVGGTLSLADSELCYESMVTRISGSHVYVINHHSVVQNVQPHIHLVLDKVTRARKQETASRTNSFEPIISNVVFILGILYSCKPRS